MNDMIDLRPGHFTMSIWPFLLKYDLLYTPFTFLKNTYYTTIPTLSVSFYSPKKPFCCNYFRPCSIGLPSIFCQRKKFKKAVNIFSMKQTRKVSTNIFLEPAKSFFMAIHICQRQFLSNFFLKKSRVSKDNFVRFY